MTDTQCPRTFTWQSLSVYIKGIFYEYERSENNVVVETLTRGPSEYIWHLSRTDSHLELG
jgi:hypothetical protein